MLHALHHYPGVVVEPSSCRFSPGHGNQVNGVKLAGHASPCRDAVVLAKAACFAQHHLLCPALIASWHVLSVQVSGAAVIAMPHAKWVERPLLVVKPNAGAVINKQGLLAILQVVLCLDIDDGLSMHTARTLLVMVYQVSLIYGEAWTQPKSYVYHMYSLCVQYVEVRCIIHPQMVSYMTCVK